MFFLLFYILYSMIGSNMMFNIMEYFSFINLCLLFLFIIISLFFILIKSTLLYYSNVNINHCLIEFISTLFSLLFLMLIISPTLIMLLDFDLMMLPSFIIYSLGLQWAWQFNCIFLPMNIGFESYCDHYIMSSINKKSIGWMMDKKLKAFNWLKADLSMDRSLFISYSSSIIDYYSFINQLMYKGSSINSYLLTSSYYWLINDRSSVIQSSVNMIESLMVTSYLIDISQYILLPIYSFIRLFVYSFDVIHTLGFYSWGIKIDAIPGSINLTTTLSLLWKGEYSGKCFELCGQGHLSMLMTTLVGFYR